MTKLVMRGLSPVSDASLFREAYDWRPTSPSKLRLERLSFEDFTSVDPSQVVMGLFNGHLCAIYLIVDHGNGEFEIHLTSRRRTPRDYVAAGAVTIVKWMESNGVRKFFGWISPRNRPLRELALDCGFQKTETREFDSRGSLIALDRYDAIL